MTDRRRRERGDSVVRLDVHRVDVVQHAVIGLGGSNEFDIDAELSTEIAREIGLMAHRRADIVGGEERTGRVRDDFPVLEHPQRLQRQAQLWIVFVDGLPVFPFEFSRITFQSGRCEFKHFLDQVIK